MDERQPVTLAVRDRDPVGPLKLFADALTMVS